MVRILERRILDAETDYIEGACLSDDTKPTGNIATGSKMLEVDTGDVYAYDEEAGGTWYVISPGSPSDGDK